MLGTWLPSVAEGCWADPGWQFSVPYNEVKADPSDFYNNEDNSAWRIAALYKIDDASSLNLQYEQFADDGAGWQSVASCELMKTQQEETLVILHMARIHVQTFWVPK